VITVEEALAARFGSSGFLLQYREHLAERDRVMFPQGVDDVNQLALVMANAPLYTWSKHIKRIVDESCTAYPLDEAVRSLHYFHQPSMFWLFDDPVLTVQPPVVAGAGADAALIDAILISPFAHGEPRSTREFCQDMLAQIHAGKEERERMVEGFRERCTGVMVHAFSSFRTSQSVPLPIGSLAVGSRLCVPIMCSYFSFGQSGAANMANIVDEQQTDPTIFEEQTRLRQWVLAATALLKQRILVAERQLATRGERKRLDKLSMPTAVMTIALRATEHTNAETGQGMVEWSHRWIVRGHWRQQWYPSQQEHRVLWIPPYIKGPDDQPLIVRPAVYTVAR
jgi:hypothetical protein